MKKTDTSTTDTYGNTLGRVQAAAMRRFAEHGYAGTSLSAIAADAGIKTPSIYAHFKGKDDLFLSLFEPAVERELMDTEAAFSDPGDIRACLRRYLEGLGDRIAALPHTRFLTLTSYLPPAHLAREVHQYIDAFMRNNGAIIGRAMERVPHPRLAPPVLAAAYAGIVDSLQTDMVYAGRESFSIRLNALWALFSLAIAGDD